jgi:dihydrodipicolinate synthase/N-acetylneuraminate lyase
MDISMRKERKMRRDDVNWRGYWPAAPTPFTADGAIDEPAWRELLELYVAQGMHGILVNGTTGEWFSQTPEERQWLAQSAVETVRGRIPVVIGCTTFRVADTLDLAEHAARIGADGVLCTPPPYAVLTPDEVVAFYRLVAQGSRLPLMVYNWPPGTNVDIDTETAVRLARIEGIVAIKDSTPHQDQLFRTLEATVDKVRFLGNFISQIGIFAVRDLGADGFIGAGALLGPLQPRFFESIWAGDLETARAIARTNTQLISRLTNPDWSGKYGAPQSQLKAAMNMLGQPGGYPRPPRLPIDDPAGLRAIREALASIGLLDGAGTG